jgi:hypothetical protein
MFRNGGITLSLEQRISQLEQLVRHLQSQNQQLLMKHNQLVELCSKMATDSLSDDNWVRGVTGLSFDEYNRREAIKKKILDAFIPPN